MTILQVGNYSLGVYTDAYRVFLLVEFNGIEKPMYLLSSYRDLQFDDGSI